MQKSFVYNAHAHVLGGFITRPAPFKFVDTVAGVSLPGTGGHQKNDVSAGYTFDPPHITIEGAGSTEVSGNQDGSGNYITEVRTKVTSLVVVDQNLGEVVRANSIESHIVATHPAAGGEPDIDVTGTMDLIIAGTPVTIELDTMLSDAKTYSKFDAKYGSKPNVGKSSKGIMRCSLIKKITHPKAQPATDQQVIKVDGFGLIYLAEAYVKQDERRITMMRLELGSPVAGSVTVCGGDGNGTQFP